MKKSEHSEQEKSCTPGSVIDSMDGIAMDPQVLSFVLENANDAVYIFDENRQILYVNEQACKQSEYTREALLQMNIAQIDPAYPPTAPETFKTRAQVGGRTEIESTHRTRSGNLIPVEISLVASVFNGRVYNSAFVRDISLRKAMLRDAERLRFAIQNASDAIYLYDRSGIIHFANEAACDVLGYKLEEIQHIRVVDLDPLFSEASNLAFWREDGAQILTKQTTHRKKDGSIYPVEIVATATSFEDKQCAVCFVRDISDRVRAEQAMRNGEQRFRLIADTSPVAMMICESTAGSIQYANRQALKMFGLDAVAMLDHSLQALLRKSRVDEDDISMLCGEEANQNLEVELRHGQESLWVSINTSLLLLEGQPMMCCALMDVTEAHELAIQLAYQATYDDLTGLVNRREFEDRLQEVIELSQEANTSNALCYLDLDQFKVINDTCGHMAGDELLRQLAQELYACVRRNDTLARLGGDEFAILLENCTLENAEWVADNVRTMIQNFRFMWNENIFTIGVSIGLTLIGTEGDSITEVLRRADAACYAAKEAGRNRLHIFSFDDEELALRHVEMRWVGRINAALDENRFELWFQEIAEIQDGEDSRSSTAEHHFEILLRMRDTDGDLVLPGSFFPAAERFDLASKIDGWVIKALFEWFRAKPQALNSLGLCAVNLSGQTLSNEKFLAELVGLLRLGIIPPEKLCFEITETAAIANLSSATAFMQTLKAYGCSFALDDFGSGLSSFGYLKNLPVDFVKIDGFFVKDILTDPVDHAMVKAIIDMTKAMGKLTIAEFVENDEILHELIELGVNYVQGYGIATPVVLR